MHDGRYWGRGGVIESHVIAGRRGATEEELTAAFKRASVGEMLPLQHELLLQARTAQFDSEPRRAVIDATSAAEVAIAQWVHGRLEERGLSSDEALAISAQANGIVDLYKLAASLGLKLATSGRRVADQIAGPRNVAVHRGAPPSHDVAARAVRSSQEIVDEVSPFRLA